MQIPAQRMSVAEYMEMEERTQIRHEYVDGYVYALSGASSPHNLLTTNLCSLAWHGRATRACRIFTHAEKVYVAASNSIYYPDVVGSCDSTDGASGYLERPCFVIEVLSPSTAKIDRTEKRDDYLTIPSLDEYVLVDQSRMQVSVYRRKCSPWPEVLEAPDDVLKLTCIGVGIALADIYEGIACRNDGVRSELKLPAHVTSMSLEA